MSNDGALARVKRVGLGKSVVIAFFALITGWYASWISTNTTLSYILVFLVVALVTSYILYGEGSYVRLVSSGLYVLAFFVAITPVFFYAPILTSDIENPWIFIFSVADLIVWLIFLVIAGILAGSGYLIKRYSG
ncbi:MAG: hypothetical protein SV377_03165 [Halobacteria archaeon]|nr:hypothetical protein [Halobacteria archaeon]